jgi:hypothetical protein
MGGTCSTNEEVKIFDRKSKSSWRLAQCYVDMRHTDIIRQRTVFQCTTVYYSVLQCTTVYSRVLQCTTVYSSVLLAHWNPGCEFVCVFFCIRDLAKGRSPIQGVVTDIYNKIQRPRKRHALGLLALGFFNVWNSHTIIFVTAVCGV